MQRRLDSTRRGRDRAIRLLAELAAVPIAVPPPQPEIEPDAVNPELPTPSSQNGFVPATPSETPTEASEDPVPTS